MTAPCLFAALTFLAAGTNPAPPGDLLFRSREEREGFLAALAELDRHYDPAERMLERPFASPGCRTTPAAGRIHPTRESLAYAVGLLDWGDPERLRQAEEVLRRVIGLQDQDPESRTYGLWPRSLEEPLARMSPPDGGWADVCAVHLLQAALDHGDRFAPDLQDLVKGSILHAAASIRRRDTGPAAAGLALLGTSVTLMAGETFGAEDLRSYGAARLKRLFDFTQENGSFEELSSPTSTIAAIEAVSRMLRQVRDPEARRRLEALDRFAWKHTARRFHPPTAQWAGPQGLSCGTLLGTEALAFLQRASGGALGFLPAPEAAVSLDAHRLRARCPEEFLPLLRDLAAPRLEVEAFHRGAPGEADIIGTTWLHPAYTIGSVNIGDLGARRRPLVAYWKRNGTPAALRVRCLRNGTDFPSAGLFSVQDRGDVLGAVVFATDREDAPGPSDPVTDGPILAEDLRVRFEIEGAADIPMSANLRPSGAARLALGPAACDIQVIHASLGGPAAPLEAGSDGRSSWIDAVLYHGAPRDLIVPSRSRAAVIFALSLRAPAEGIPAGMDSTASFTGSTATVIWRRGGGTALLLSVPVRPLPEAAQRRSAAARRGGGDPWKAQEPPAPLE